MPSFTTACPRNCYSTCTMTVRVENGRLARIDAHAGNLATATGPCLKGLSYVERIYSPDRLLRPLRRLPRSGTFQPIAWDDALDEIAGRLTRYRPEPQSVLFYSASGTKGLMNRVSTRFWRLYGGYTTTYGDLCWPAGLEATRLMLGDNTHNAPWDLANAKLIVLWGKNAAETNIHQMVFVDRALDAGATLVVIDPRRTQSAERASLLIQPRPGTDGALALAVAHLLIASGRIDREFVARHVHGFDAFARSASEWTPGRAAEVTEVPADHIRRLADLFAIAPATICAGFGLQRFTNGGQTMRATDRAAGDHGEHRTARRRLGLREPPEPHLRRRARSDRLVSTRAARRRRARIDLDGETRARHAGPAGSAAGDGVGRARQSDPAESANRTRRRGVPGARLPRGRRAVPDRHGARSGHRSARQDDVRAVRRHRRLLARLPAAEAEGCRTARRGQARVRNLPPARAAPRDGGGRRRRRVPGDG